MNLKQEMKYFKAVTYNGEEYNFAVTPENQICCIEFGIDKKANLIELKPNFVFYSINFYLSSLLHILYYTKISFLL